MYYDQGRSDYLDYSGFYNTVTECGFLKGLQVKRFATTPSGDDFKYATDSEAGNYSTADARYNLCPLDAPCSQNADCDRAAAPYGRVVCKASKCTYVQPIEGPFLSYTQVSNVLWLEREYFNASPLVSTIFATAIAIVAAVVMF